MRKTWAEVFFFNEDVGGGRRRKTTTTTTIAAAATTGERWSDQWRNASINMDEREVAEVAAPRFCLDEFETKCSLIPTLPAGRRDVYRETLAVG